MSKKPKQQNEGFLRNLNLLRLVLAVTLIVHVAGLYAFLQPIYADGLLLTFRRGILLGLVGIAALVMELAILAAALFAKKSTLRKFSHRIIQILGRLKALNLVFYLLALVVCSVLIFAPLYGKYVPGFITVLSAYWLTALVGSLFLKSWAAARLISGSGEQRLTESHSPEPSPGWPACLGLSLLLTTCGFRIACSLQDITAFPFTLGWSETSRYYYASLYFSEKIYGLEIPPMRSHSTRYLMQAVPFLLPGLPLWLHRAWQVFLWLGTTSLTSWMLLRRLRIPSRWNQAFVFSVSFLFLLIGPVYYTLQISLILVLWGFRTGLAHHPRLRFLRSLFVVVAASAWAGISRVNWYPLPGLLAACLYLLEKPLQPSDAPAQGKPTLRSMAAYLVEPVAWTLIGLACAFAAKPIFITGHPAKQFATRFSSELLWYRLLPNSTYLPGILLGALLTSLPFFYLIWKRLNVGTFQRLNTLFHPIRLSGLSAVLLVFFAGGLVVSTKIGGGSNLHNMDAYQALLLIIASMIYFGKYAPEISTAPTSPVKNTEPVISRVWAILSVIILVFFSFLDNSVRPPLPDQGTVQSGLDIIAQRAAQALEQGGDVLFISNRQLLTFGYIQGVPLFPDYERLYLMEMAMSGKTEYLEKLRQDLANGRFSLIIAEPLTVKIKDESTKFGEENNIWIEQVIRMMRCYYNEDKIGYEKRFILRDLQIEFLVPDPTPNPVQCEKMQ